MIDPMSRYSSMHAIYSHICFAQIMMQWLAKLAIISGRVPVWPTVDCSASYAIGNDVKAPKGEPSPRGTAIPDDWLPYWSRSWKKAHCYFIHLMEPGAKGFWHV